MNPTTKHNSQETKHNLVKSLVDQSGAQVNSTDSTFEAFRCNLAHGSSAASALELTTLTNCLNEVLLSG